MAEALLGPPNKALSTRSTLRWGAKGSLKLEIRGHKKGLWFSHESTHGRDMFGLIQQELGCGFPDAIAWARSHTGLADEQSEAADVRARRAQQDADRRARHAADDAKGQAEEAVRKASRTALAQRIAAEASPVTETMGDYYLRQVRGIPRPAAGWPETVRFHHGNGALVVVSTRDDGTVQAVQQVYLDAQGGKIGEDEMRRRRLPAVKVTTGPQDGAAVRFPGDPAGPLLLAEGPETGLSAYTSTGFETWLTLGGIAKAQAPIGRRVVVVSDDNPPPHDAKYGQAAKSLRKVVKAWRQAGVDVVVATPWIVRKRDRSDMNDVILHHGVEAVRARIMAALCRKAAPGGRLPIAEAEAATAKAIGAFFSKVEAASVARSEWDDQARAAMDQNRTTAPRQVEPDEASDADMWSEALNTEPLPNAPDINKMAHAVRVDVGVGKSHTAREGVVQLLASMRKRGDMRSIAIAVPTHALGDEQAELFELLPLAKDAGLVAAVWRGRSAPDPDAPGFADPTIPKAAKDTMCGDLERVHDAQQVSLNPQTAACVRTVKQSDGTKKKHYCPLFHACAYQAQIRRKADLWIVPHELLFSERPDALGELAAVIVDEAAWQDGLIGTTGRPLSITLDAVRAGAKIFGKDGRRLRDSEGRLDSIRTMLADALEGATDDGPVATVDFDTSNMTADTAAEAFKLEWMRKIDTLHPGQSRAERRKAMEAAEDNKTISRMAMIWSAIRVLLTPGGPARSGWLEVGTESTVDGPVRVLRLKGRKDIKEGWQVPTLLLDALLPIDLVRFFWPTAELVADVKAAAPHQHARQVIDKAFAKSMLEPLAEEAAEANRGEAKRRLNRLHDLRAMLIREARRHAPGQVLIVLQKAIKEALLELGRLPANIDLAHHNNIAGRDEWRNVAALIVVGRTQPSTHGAERIAEALTGHAIAQPLAWYERADAVREMADGSTIPAEADRHPDLIVEAIRWLACEGELVQIIGRARGVRRTEANPVDVLVLTDVPIPVAIEGTVDASNLEPSVSDQMLAAGGIIFENPTDAALAYPLLWGTRAAAKSALQRGKLGAFPYRESIIGVCTQLRRIDYKAAGQGKQATTAGHDPVLCTDPEAFLREKLGALTWCRVEGRDDPEPDPPPAPDTPPAGPPDPSCDELARSDHDDCWPEANPYSDETPPDDGGGIRFDLADVVRGTDEVAPVDQGSQCDELLIPVELKPALRRKAAAKKTDAQDRGEIATQSDHGAGIQANVQTSDNSPATLPDIGIPRQRAAAAVDSTEAPSGPTCDAPWLHPETAGYSAPGGITVAICPHCGEVHRHHGFGHRLAHCIDPRGRGYVLRPAGVAPASMLRPGLGAGWPLGP